MTVIKNTATLSDAGVLTITDTTGFYNVSTNPTGFTPEASSADPSRYKLSNGWFINIIYYNKYNSAPVLINTSELWSRVTSFSTNYPDNFTPETYQLTQDGSYTIKRIFLISDTFYNANKTGSLFTGKTIYYTDGSLVYKVVSGVATSIALVDFAALDFTNITGLATSTAFISTCFLNQCYYRINLELMPFASLCDTEKEKVLKRNRDFIFITLEVIRYLIAQDLPTEVQRVLESSDVCGVICKRVLTGTNYDCGCNS